MSRGIKELSVEFKQRSAFMANIQNCHGMAALAPKRVIAEGQQKRGPPSIEGCEGASLFFWDSQKDFIGLFVALGIKTVVSNHFKMFVGYMDNELFNKLCGRDFLRYQFIVFMPVVVESNKGAVIIINTGSGDDRPAEISAYVFDNIFDIGKGRFGVDIEAVGAVFVDEGLCLFKRFADVFFHGV